MDEYKEFQKDPEVRLACERAYNSGAATELLIYYQIKWDA